MNLFKMKNWMTDWMSEWQTDKLLDFFQNKMKSKLMELFFVVSFVDIVTVQGLEEQNKFQEKQLKLKIKDKNCLSW